LSSRTSAWGEDPGPPEARRSGSVPDPSLRFVRDDRVVCGASENSSRSTVHTTASGATPFARSARAAARQPSKSISDSSRATRIRTGSTARRDQGRPQVLAVGGRARRPVGGDDERLGALDRAADALDVVQGQPGLGSGLQDAVDAARAQARRAQQGLAVGGVDVDREVAAMAQGPGGLGIDLRSRSSPGATISPWPKP
jgi:hypothetical protein